MKQIRFTDVDSFQHNKERAMVLMQIERQDIMSGNLASTLEKLHILADTKENVLLYRECLAFQISGFDRDKRELPEIPEVRAFFKKLAQEWPHWIWFMCRGTGSLALLFSLLCKVRILRKKGVPGFGTEFLDGNELSETIGDLFNRGNVLFDTFEISESLVEASAESMTNELFNG